MMKNTLRSGYVTPLQCFVDLIGVSKITRQFECSITPYITLNLSMSTSTQGISMAIQNDANEIFNYSFQF